MKRSFVIFNKVFVFPIIRAFFLKEIKGKENIPKNGNFIIASNHVNNLDHWLISEAFEERFKDFCFLGKREGLNGLLRLILDFFAETITFKPKDYERKKILEKMEKVLKEGKILIIYPEGNGNKKTELLKGKTGVAEIALRTNLPILPVGISKIGKLKKKVEIGKPMLFKLVPYRTEGSGAGLENEFKNYQEFNHLLVKITDEIMVEISKLSGKPYPYAQLC